ncbi:hypothetical protein ASPBRDRAFT_42845 [Aspergillus brasiliensis CBS 101740]|uniref:Uncharacterized protein n=1 Tax=Aspergillus brasiliensis (strain CBS 101740 / IMI 381727 / IBT 21946) TaxID=767769 RepID=A0A1L9UIY1_ASPBC|nr:hypothetical protein ASPBRDRAFT_42845 [Aspergillus brasiliensis CBS 101740]
MTQRIFAPDMNGLGAATDRYIDTTVKRMAMPNILCTGEDCMPKRDVSFSLLVVLTVSVNFMVTIGAAIMMLFHVNG